MILVLERSGLADIHVFLLGSHHLVPVNKKFIHPKIKACRWKLVSPFLHFHVSEGRRFCWMKIEIQ